MFPSELMIVFSNLLSNAAKAAGHRGRILAKTRKSPEGGTLIQIHNTGTKVSLRDAEKWFLPFQSTSVSTDPLLGQGMGMGLPIVRNILEEYGATIRFTKPEPGFSTSIEIEFT
jgi:signal transduction histidine kinase